MPLFNFGAVSSLASPDSFKGGTEEQEDRWMANLLRYALTPEQVAATELMKLKIR